MIQEALSKDKLQEKNGVRIKMTPFAYSEAGRENIEEIIGLILENNKVNNNFVKFKNVDYFWSVRMLKENNSKRPILVIYFKDDIM